VASDTLVLLWAICRDIILMEPSNVTVVLRGLSADHVSAVDQRKKRPMVVSVVKLQEPLESLRKAIELCGGSEGLGRDDKSASPAPPIQGSRARPSSVSEPMPSVSKRLWDSSCLSRFHDQTRDLGHQLPWHEPDEEHAQICC